ncbi:MAG TPA: ComEA family DNA-binding protein [Bacillales bacterium]|nr:ComEA family DNA-binding protein [Bacillales bacterium]
MVNFTNWTKREQWLAGLALFFLLGWAATVVYMKTEASASSDSVQWLHKETGEAPMMTKRKKDPKNAKTPMAVVIDVKGAVVTPGVYEMKEGERVIDVIREAGGFRKEADRKRINLAERLKDQMVVYVPEKGEKGAQAEFMPSQDDGKVNVNSASVSDLEKLPGVGEVTAEAIVAFRKQHGPFKQLSDLLAVKGIGEKTLDTLREKIALH